MNLTHKNSNSLNNSNLYDNPYDRERIDRKYQFPASSKAAKVHKRATKFGYNAPFLKDGTETPICPCCENLVNTVPISLCQDTSPMFFCGDTDIDQGERVFLLSSGTAMYFIFIKMCIYYLLMRFLICDLYNIISSHEGHFCKQNPQLCSGDFYSFLSGYNKHTPQDIPMVDIVDILNIVVTVLSIVYFYFCRNYQYKVNSFLKRSQTSQDQFTIFVQNIPLFIHEEDTKNQNVKFEYQKFLTNKISEEIKKWIAKVRKYHNEDEIKGHLEKEFYRFITSSGKEVENEPIVTTISLCYDVTEMENIDEQRQKLMDKYLKNVRSDANHSKGDHVHDSHRKSNEPSDLLSYIPNQVKILNEKSIELSKHFALDNSPAFNLSHFIGKAFVTFRYQHYRRYFLREAEENPNFFKLIEQPILIERAGKPNDVFWRNLKISNEERNNKHWTSFFILSLVIIFSLAVLVGVDQLQGYLVKAARKGNEPASPPTANNFSINNVSTNTHLASNDNHKGESSNDIINMDKIWESLTGFVNQLKEHSGDAEYVKQQAISYLFAAIFPIIINFINFLIKYFIDYLTKLQKHTSKTREVSSFIFKNVIWRFTNTAIIYFVIALLHQTTGPLTQEGIVLKVMGLIGFSALLHIFTQLIAVKPEIILQWILTCCPKCCCCKERQDKAVDLFQIQLNKQSQLPEFDFAEQYCVFLVQTLVASFYATLVPLGVGILALMFIGQYWVSKRNLFHRSSCSQDFNFYLTRFAFKTFECSLLVFAVGNLIFDSRIHVDAEPKFKIINWIVVIIAGVYVCFILFAPQWLVNKFFSQEKDYFQNPYEYFVQKKAFKKTYWMENPATAFLKERKLSKEDTTKTTPTYLQMVLKEHCDKFIHLTEDDIKYQVYSKDDVDHFLKIGVMKGQKPKETETKA